MPSLPTNRTVATPDVDHVDDHNTLHALNNELDGHAAAADPHGQYQKESEKGQASGYAALDANGRVPVAQLGSGSPSGTTVLHGDGAWKVTSGGGGGLDAEGVEDVVGGMVSGNTESGITVTYDDATGKVNFTVTDSPTVGGVTPAQLRDRTTHTGTQLASTISDLTETTQDIVGEMVTGNTETGITVTYDDATGKLNFSVSGGGGGSAVITAWKDVTKDPYNATGTGDETAKVQQAVDDASAASGDGIGVVFIPDRIINVTNVVAKSNVWMVGGSWRAGLKKVAGSEGGAIRNLYQYQTGAAPLEKFGVFNMRIDGNKANASTGAGLKLHNMKHIIVANCYVFDCAAGCIVVGDNVEGTVERVLITNNWCEAAGVSGNFWGCIGVTSGTEIIISNNLCIGKDGVTSYGIDVEPNAGSAWGSARRVNITANVLRECTLIVAAPSTASTGNAECEQILIANNVVNAINASGGGPAIRVSECTGNIMISGNYAHGIGHTSPAIRLLDLIDPMLVGNYCTGMGVNQGTYPSNVGIEVTDVIGGYIGGNYIKAAAATHATAVAGIRETGTTANVIYGHNAMKNITVPGVHRLDLQTAYIQMTEQADPAAPAANAARLFTRDNGSGKTQVCVRFATGAVQVLATEP